MDRVLVSGILMLSQDRYILRRSGETSTLVVVNTDGTDRRVVIDRGLSWYPRWSPDGRWLVYTAPKY